MVVLERVYILFQELALAFLASGKGGGIRFTIFVKEPGARRKQNRLHCAGGCKNKMR